MQTTCVGATQFERRKNFRDLCHDLCLNLGEVELASPYEDKLRLVVLQNTSTKRKRVNPRI